MERSLSEKFENKIDALIESIDDIEKLDYIGERVCTRSVYIFIKHQYQKYKKGDFYVYNQAMHIISPTHTEVQTEALYAVAVLLLLDMCKYGTANANYLSYHGFIDICDTKYNLDVKICPEEVNVIIKKKNILCHELARIIKYAYCTWMNICV